MKFLKKHQKAVFLTLGVLFVILLWEIIAYATSQTFLKDFFLTCKESILLLGKSDTYLNLGFTLLRLLISFVISFVLGTTLGILGGYYPQVEHFLSPLISVMKSFPTIALALLTVVFLPNFSLVVTSFALFPLLYLASLEGSKKTYQQYENIIRMKGRKHFSNITSVILPLSSNYLLLGALQSLTFGFKVEIMAETLSYRSTFLGVGRMIYLCYSSVDYLSLMAWVLLVLILSLVIDVLLSYVKNKIESAVKKPEED